MAQNLVPIFPQNSATYIADWGNIQTQVDGAETVSRHLPSHGLATWPLNCFRHFFHFILPLSAPSTRVRWKVFSAPSTFTPVYIISYNYTFIHINININIKIYIDIIINIEIDIDIDINIDIYIYMQRIRPDGMSGWGPLESNFYHRGYPWIIVKFVNEFMSIDMIFESPDNYTK